MKFFKKIAALWEVFNVKVHLFARIMLGIILLLGIEVPIILSVINPQNHQPSERFENHENVYLYEVDFFATSWADSILIRE